MIPALLALIVTVSVVILSGGPAEKVTICHVPPPPVTLEVALPALPAHLAHGDTLGPCPVTLTTTTTTNPPTTTTTPATTTDEPDASTPDDSTPAVPALPTFTG